MPCFTYSARVGPPLDVLRTICYGATRMGGM